MNFFKYILLLPAIFVASWVEAQKQEDMPIACNYVGISGVYPHLAFWNKEGECGTGALANWAGKFWALTYGPHCDSYSSDKLYEITPSTLDIAIRKESAGGTHANRLIHEESKQLLIGCYAIDENGNVRVIGREDMHGRITGTARSLQTPESSVYFATMEEGLYEVDVNTLKVREIIRDGNLKDYPQKFDKNGKPLPRKSNLHGYHGKGLYSGFGKLFYANNGIRHPKVAEDPTITSGALAFWECGDSDWTEIRKCQFTEITSKDGITGSKNPESTPIWALGWDAKSVILMLNDGGNWSSFRLPKSSHSYDGSHGWNTEWPRIRNIGGDEYLMTMHGAFWRFPKSFSKKDFSGIRMRSSYLKVIGDFCRWGDVIALGCDDSAQKEFMNSRDLKAKKAHPLNSNSNIWFVSDGRLDNLGAKLGRGSVFLRENVASGTLSDAMLTAGFDKRILVLDHKTDAPVLIEIQTSDGKSDFVKSREITLDKNSSKFIELEDAEWTRIVPRTDAVSLSAHFTLFDFEKRIPSNIFDGIAKRGSKNANAALLRSMGIKSKKLGALARGKDGGNIYSLNESLKLVKDSSVKESVLAETEEAPKGISYVGDTVLIEERGVRYLLPCNKSFDGTSEFGILRVAREVVTERDLLNCGGTFYELPAVNAQGMAKVRPIASHDFDIFDFCSFGGLMFMSGIENGAEKLSNRHIITSDDGKLSLWAGVIDDLWKLGKPVGKGSPWICKKVSAGETSDMLLLTGYDKKSVYAVSSSDTDLDIEVDVDGTGLWVKYETIKLKAGIPFEKTFSDDFCGYWVRVKTSNSSEKISVSFIYE